MTAEVLKTEAVIVGGGLVGLTLGLALARGGVECIVVDALDPAKVTDAGFDGRVSAIAFASAKALISPYFVKTNPMNDVEGKPRSASLKLDLGIGTVAVLLASMGVLLI